MSNSEHRRNRLKQIPKEIEALTKELESLLLQEVSTNTNSSLKIGDRVVLTNNHRGLNGSTGTISAVTKARFKITLDDGKTIYRAKDNVKLEDDRTRQH
jgi:preprotein translocase subunit YajC